MLTRIALPVEKIACRIRAARKAASGWGGVTILLLIGVLFWHRLGERDLWGSHEARAAQNAQRMLDDGSWGLPRLFDDHFDLQKPPLYYWLVASAGWLNGGEVDEFIVRLPAALSASLVVLLVYAVLRVRGRPIAAFLAALILATAQHFTWLARTARIDMPLTLCVAISVLAVVESRRGQMVGFIAMAAGMLLKGPIGLMLPLAVIIINLLASHGACRHCSDSSHSTTGTSPMGRLRSLLWGIPLALALATPWYIWANAKTDGEFFRVFFWYHNVQRALGSAPALAQHPWWYYAPRLLVDALPWSVLLIPAAVWAVRRGIWRIDAQARLGACWLIAVVVILSCAKFKRGDYLLPAYPGFAVFLGCMGERCWLAVQPGLRRVLALSFAGTIAVMAGGWLYFVHVELPRQEPEKELKWFAQAIREVAPRPEVILFFRTEAHALSFHVGRPVNTFLEWENLDVWAGRPGTHYIVMSPESAEQWRQHVTAGELEEVLRSTDLSGGRHERPLVLMRTKSATRDAPPGQQTANERRPDQRRRPGAQSIGTDRQSIIGLGQLPGEARTAVRNPGR